MTVWVGAVASGDDNAEYTRSDTSGNWSGPNTNPSSLRANAASGSGTRRRAAAIIRNLPPGLGPGDQIVSARLRAHIVPGYNRGFNVVIARGAEFATFDTGTQLAEVSWDDPVVEWDATAVVQSWVDNDTWPAHANVRMWTTFNNERRAVSHAGGNPPELIIEYAQAGPPTAAFTYQAVGDGQVQFQDLSSPALEPITAWQWDFGDGATSTEQHPVHTFTASGDHDVTLTVTADDDLTGTVTTTVHVPPWQLEATITGGITGRTVDMAAVVITPDPPITSYQWAMGDGTVLTGADITHTYQTPGEYTIVLTVTDSAANQVTVTRQVRTQEVTDWHDVDPAVIERLLADHVRTTTAMIEIINPDGETAATLGGPDKTHPGAISGTVTIDGSRHVRHSADLTIADPDLIPDNTGDLLHPLARNQVRIWWLLQAPDGTWVRRVLATGYVAKPATTDDGIPRLTIEIEDVAARVAAARWDIAPDTEGQTISGAAGIIWADRVPIAQTRIVPTNQAPPEDWEIGAPGEDPNDDLDRLAEAAGYVWYADARGHLVFEPEPDPGTIMASWAEGPGCQVTEMGRELSLEDTANVVQVISTSNEVDPPIEVTVSNTDDDSPLSVDRGWRMVAPVVESGEVATTEQARELATKKLAEYTALTEMVDVVHRVDPRVTAGVHIHLEREASRVSGTYQVMSTSIPVGGSWQRTVMAPRKVKV